MKVSTLSIHFCLLSDLELSTEFLLYLWVFRANTFYFAMLATLYLPVFIKHLSSRQRILHFAISRAGRLALCY